MKLILVHTIFYERVKLKLPSLVHLLEGLYNFYLLLGPLGLDLSSDDRSVAIFLSVTSLDFFIVEEVERNLPDARVEDARAVGNL